MALFKKLKGANSKSTPDLKQVVDNNKQDEVAPASSSTVQNSDRASRSTDTTTPSTSPPETPSTSPRKAWVPKQKGLVPQPAIPYRQIPTHAATDAYRTLQGGKGQNASAYWQNLGVFPRGGRQYPRRSQSSSEISSGSIDSVLCSCAALKADDGYYHPLLASEMRHCCHSPIRKSKTGSSRGSSTTSSTPASSVYSVPIGSSKPSSMKDASVIKPSKSVTFEDALLNRLEEEVSAAVNDPAYLTEPVPRIPMAFMLPSSDDDASTDSGLPSIAEAVVLESPLEESHEEVVAEAVAEDDAQSVSAFEADAIVYTSKHLGKQQRFGE